MPRKRPGKLYLSWRIGRVYIGGRFDAIFDRAATGRNGECVSPAFFSPDPKRFGGKLLMIFTATFEVDANNQTDKRMPASRVEKERAKVQSNRTKSVERSN